MLSTHICVMALTLVGVTPGGFNADSDCNVVVNSSSAAIVTSNVPVKLEKKEKEMLAMLHTAAESLCGDLPRREHAIYSRAQVKDRREKTRLYEESGVE